MRRPVSALSATYILIRGVNWLHGKLSALVGLRGASVPNKDFIHPLTSIKNKWSVASRVPLTLHFDIDNKEFLYSALICRNLMFTFQRDLNDSFELLQIFRRIIIFPCMLFYDYLWDGTTDFNNVTEGKRISVIAILRISRIHNYKGEGKFAFLKEAARYYNSRLAIVVNQVFQTWTTQSVFADSNNFQ